ncbi:MAG: N-formylglutamate amidohydrolase, partial [Pseudomonadota bacterium]
SNWHAPYHEQLMTLLMRARRRFGSAVLIDCHSMPSLAPGIRARRGGGQADVVLGDRFGVSAEAGVVDAIEAAFVDAGLRVTRNAPFAGGYITERYGRPAAGVSAVQIEIDRALYLDEERVQPGARFERFKSSLGPVIERLCALGGGPGASALAAE